MCCQVQFTTVKHHHWSSLHIFDLFNMRCNVLSVQLPLQPHDCPRLCSSSFSTVQFVQCSLCDCAVCQCVLCAVCCVLLLCSAGIIASNTNQPSSGSLRIIGQLDLFNRRIIGQKIMAASKYQTARKWDTGHYGSKEVPGVLGQKGDFPKKHWSSNCFHFPFPSNQVLVLKPPKK